MKNWVIALLLVLLGAAAYYYFTVYQQQEPVVQPEPVVEAAPPEPEPVTEPAEPEVIEETGPDLEAPPAPQIEEVPMPTLAESDTVAFEEAADLIGEPQVAEYLAADNLVSRLVTTVDALGSRQVPGAIQAVREPAGNFEAIPDEQPDAIIRNEAGDPIPQYLLSPANYGRYTPYVELLEGLDTEQFVASYRAHEELVQEAYRMQGYPDGDFNERLVAIIDELLATPRVSDPVRLIKPEAYFLFADPDLEALTAGQKILIRMGDANAARVKAKLTEIRQALQ